MVDVDVAALSGDSSTASVGSATVSADYSEATDTSLTLVVSTAGLDTNYDATMAFLAEVNAAIAATGYAVDEEDVFEVTLRSADNSIVEGNNGLYSFTFGVGNEYDGMTLAVYILVDEELVPYYGVVSKGKLTITGVPIAKLSVFFIAKPAL